MVYDTMTERLKYKYVEISSRETFDKTWSTTRRFTIEGDGTVPAHGQPAAAPIMQAAAASAAAVPVAAPIGDADGSGEGGRRVRQRVDAGAAPPAAPALSAPKAKAPPVPPAAAAGAATAEGPPRAASSRDAARQSIAARRSQAKAKIAAAAKPKARSRPVPPEQAFKTAVSKYVVLCASGDNLINTIETVESWTWARTDLLLGELQAAVRNLKDEVSELVSVHIGEGWKAVTELYEETELNVHLQTVAADLEPKLLLVEDAIRRIKDMNKRMLT